jgi:hypothetical protein
MPFVVDPTSEPGILRLELSGALTTSEMAAFVEQHNRAIDAFGRHDYRVFCDIRQLAPLSPACAALFEKAKAHSAGKKNFRGSAVLVSSALASIQHRRTSVASGVMDTELITDDEAACRKHLAAVRRH